MNLVYHLGTKLRSTTIYYTIQPAGKSMNLRSTYCNIHQLIRKETVNSRSTTMQNHHLNSGFKGGKMPICSGYLVRQERIAKLETEVQSLKQKLGEAAVSGKLPWCQKNLTWIMEPENGKFQEEHDLQRSAKNVVVG